MSGTYTNHPNLTSSARTPTIPTAFSVYRTPSTRLNPMDHRTRPAEEQCLALRAPATSQVLPRPLDVAILRRAILGRPATRVREP